jgi:cell division septation protein DedD
MFGMQEAEEPRRGPRGVGIAVAAVVIAAFVAGIWYIYDRGVRRGDLKALPVITADGGPIKSTPADAGGMKVPHVDGEMPRASTARAGKVEDILPPPERPLTERPPLPRAAEPPKPAAAAPVEAPKAEMPKAEVPKTEAPAAAPGPVAAVEVAPRPTPAAPPATAEKAAPPPAAEKSAPAAPPAAEKAAPAVAAVAPAAGRLAASGYRIQLASVGDRQAAENEWRRLSRANADVLGRLTSNIVAVDLPGKGTFHRLSAGPFADRGAAAEACEALKKRKVGCFVVAP